MNEVINKQTFFDNWSGQSTPLQKKLIAEWLNQPENVELYYGWLDEWERANLLMTADTNKAYEKFIARQQQEAGNTISPPNRFFLKRKNLKRFAVAAVTIAFISTLLFLTKNSILNKNINTAFGETRELTLPDGSKVYMNANSSLRYPRFGFNGPQRKVYITGEAEFSVVHTSTNSSFEVFTENNLKISVLGTRFVVYARGDQSKVVLSQGKIELSVPVGDTIQKNIMLPGDVFASDPKKGIKRMKVEEPEESAAWKNHEFHFDGTTLAEIGKLVEESFGYQLSFSTDSLSETSISGSFHAETVDDLIVAIAQLLHLNYKYKDSQIHFSE